MPQSRGSGSLTSEAGLGQRLPGVFRADYLERNRNFEVEIDRLVHPCKSAGSEESRYSILAESSAKIALGQVVVLYRCVEED